MARELSKAESKRLGLPQRNPFDGDFVIWTPFDLPTPPWQRMELLFALVEMILGDSRQFNLGALRRPKELHT